MGAKSKYAVVKLASVISGTTRVWVRDKAAAESAQILYDPAIGRNVLFKEIEQIKGRATLSEYAKTKYNILD